MKNAPALHAFEYGVYRALSGPIQVLSPATARQLGTGLGELAYLALPRRRRIALSNLALALPELNAAHHKQIARGAFRTMAAAVFDAISSRRLDAVEFCRRTTLENWPRLAAAEARGHGLILISAHLGFWEVAAQAIGLFRGTIHVVGRPLDNPYLQRQLEPIRKRFGNVMISKQGAARATMRVLRESGRVGIVIDQRVRPGQGTELPFFGHKALSSPLASQLSLRFGTPIVPVFAYPEADGRYRVVARDIIEPPESAEAVEAHAIHCLKVIEQEIRARPEMWMWMHDRWKGG
jgi:KDO2-lipid IV(A) lauroyltransferase